MLRRTSLLLLLALSSCGKDAAPMFPESTSERSPECKPCVDAGRNWTGGTCADSCLLDTYCFGPGNRAAPTCPAP